jgi:hypothetical protein
MALEQMSAISKGREKDGTVRDKLCQNRTLRAEGVGESEALVALKGLLEVPISAKKRIVSGVAVNAP